ncbi:MAG: dihydrolipoyl dehydrogenase [Holosporales bacterium]|jgi:dihydrolipoamide dehydrogenase|nr:dihydrolipoyl dehydrogenase [Holosporales bacterium]
MNFDVVIIGGGPGGYSCALRASRLGLKVAIIEKEDIGGTCLNKGCIPTKSLLHIAKTKHTIDNSEMFGIGSNVNSIDFNKIIDRTKNVVAGLNKGVSGLMKQNNIVVIKGEAKFLSKNKLIVDNKEEITAKNVVIATGALPRMLPEIDQSLMEKGLIWTSKEAMFATKCPQKLLIIGSGAIGIEFASFYNAMGSDVTVLEIQDRILINEDEDISKFAQRAMEKKGIKFALGTASCGISEKNELICVEFSNGNREDFEICIVAIGVVPNTRNLNLDEIGVKTEQNGAITVDKYMRTSVGEIYAIGDVTAPPFLAHKASREGVICAEKMADLENIQVLNYNAIPGCVYSSPQIGSIGQTEMKANENQIDIKVGISHFKSNGKAQAIGDSEGFVKVIFEANTGEIIGVHMIGPEVTELISVFSLAIASELTEKEIISTIFPHPTMSETLQDAVMMAFD